MTNKPKCCEKVYRNYHYYPCGKPGKVERDGKWHCGVHDPVRLKAISDKTDAKYKAKSQALDLVWKRSDAERQACEGVATELLIPGLLKTLLSNKEA